MIDDNLPRFHKLAPNAVAFSGYNGRGIAPGTVFGRLLAEYISGSLAEDGLPLPVTDPRDSTFRHLKEALYEVGSQIVHFAQARF